MRAVVYKASQIVFTLVVLVGMGAFSSLAQLPTGTILGTVRDATGAVVPGATVTARNTETGTIRTVSSSANGEYRFVALAIGAYELRTTSTGFQAQLSTGIRLTVGQEAVVNFSLQVGAIEQTVEVTAEAPIVNTTSGSVGDLMSQQEVENLPINGRNYINLTLLQPGIQENRGGRGSSSAPGTWISVGGAPIRSNNFMLDGAPLLNDTGGITAGATGSTLGMDGIREWRLVTNATSAEYGVKMGAQFTMVSKGGTNDFHGSLFEYIRNSELDARDFFDRQTESNPRRIPNFVQNQFGGSFGGPIKQDKLFFFGTVEALRRREGVSFNRRTFPADCLTLTNNRCAVTDDNPEGIVDPQMAPILALYPAPNLPNDRFAYSSGEAGNEEYYQIRTDWNISEDDMFFVRYTYTPSDNIEAQTFEPFIRTRDVEKHWLSVSESHIFSPSLLGTFRYSFTTSDLDVDSPHEQFSGPEFSLVPGRAMGIYTPGSGISTMGPSNNVPAPRVYTTNTWSADMFYTAGRHSLKFGTLLNRFFQNNTHGNSFFGVIQFSNRSDFLNGFARRITVQGQDINNTRKYAWWTIGNYIQDDFRVNSNLTLNLGLRYEFHTTYRATDGIESALRDVVNDTEFTVGKPFKNPSKRNVSPRFGFAWDVAGDGMTAVRGGVGLLWDLSSHGSSFGNMPSTQPPFSFHNRDERVQLTHPFVFEGVRKAVRTLQFDLTSPHMLQYNFTVERQLPGGMGLSLGYVGSRGFNLAKSPGGNPVLPEIVSGDAAAGHPGQPGSPGTAFHWTKNRPGRADRLNPAWDTVQYHTSASNSWYSSLQAVVRKQMAQGLQFQTAYTWSRLLDEGQGQSSLDGAGTYHPWLRSHDRGLSKMHAAHAIRTSTIFQLPNTPYEGVAGALMNGWGVAGIVSLQTGTPLNVELDDDTSRSNYDDRPDLVVGRSFDSIIQDNRPERSEGYVDTSAFQVQELGYLGNAGRNILTGPGLANVDFSVTKNMPAGFLGESGNLQFRAEFFNIFNRVNLECPGSRCDVAIFEGGTGGGRFDVIDPQSSGSQFAGTITSTTTTSRQIQLALRLTF